MNIQQATQQYETWLASQVNVVKSDLAAKHQQMSKDAFSFLRATFYRWMQLFPALCPELTGAPVVLSVGDLHMENYGTWRDAEGRLVWGVNDFDEAFPLPYTNDLVRLATSAWLATEIAQLSLAPSKACAAILEGYSKEWEDGGKPVVLSERNRWLRAEVTSRLRDPAGYWANLAALPSVRRVPTEVMLLLKKAMPENRLAFRVMHRRSGLGSLGRERFTAIAEWRGGKIVREAKALLPSACVWAGGLSDQEIYYSQTVQGAVRAPDPFLMLRGGWVLRRLSPDCSRIELSQLPRSRDEERLLRAMGRELANIHLGSRRAVAAVRRDVRQRKPKWLRQAAEVMLEIILKEWKEWKKCVR